MNPKLLPASFVRLISQADRARLGIKTQEEAIAAAEVKSERQLQSQIANLLSLRDIIYCWHRTDRKSHATVGWPDFSFAVRTGGAPIAFAWECKLPGRSLDPEQEKMKGHMTSGVNGWTYCVIHSVDEALMELRRLGL